MAWRYRLLCDRNREGACEWVLRSVTSPGAHILARAGLATSVGRLLSALGGEML